MTNGKNGSQIKAEKSADRDADGHFLPGHGVRSPGRPKGSLDFMAICRRESKKSGMDLETLVWAMAKGTIARAAKGDPAACKLMLDRLCGILEKGMHLHVGDDNRQLNLGAGPPVPGTRELGEYFAQLGELSDDLLTVEIVERCEAQELEDLLS